jgi:TnpA family transposase
MDRLIGVSIAVLLVVDACNITRRPVIKSNVEALTRDRLAHVEANYLRLDTIRAVNACLIEAQAGIGLARLWGGGHASVDGMRFVVPVRTIHSGPHPRYFPRGRGSRGVTWLNMINDQAAGLGAKVVAGTPRDSLHVLDVLYDRDGGTKPQMIVTDTSSYSDMCSGCCRWPAGPTRRSWPTCPDQKLWRVDPRADHGRLPPPRGAGSTWRRLPGTGRTSCGSSPRSTPVPCVPTT